MATSASSPEHGDTPETTGAKAAPTKRRGRRAPTSVPVASRDAERAKPKKKRPNRFSLKGDIVGVAVIIAVILVVLVAIAVPLRTYYDGRSEIARLNESIQAKQNERDRLLEDIAKYSNEDYIKQEARRRLGMIEPGETAWRVIDPRMDAEDAVTTAPADDVPPPRPWAEVAWDSLATPTE